MKDEALRLALEALQNNIHYTQTHLQDFDAAYNRHPSTEHERGLITDDIEDAFAAIAAIKQALEQPEPEPVAWMTITPYGEEDDIWYENPEGKLLEGWTYKPLYDTTQPQRTFIELTEAEIDEVCLGDEAKVRTALQLLKEKNT